MSCFAVYSFSLHNNLYSYHLYYLLEKQTSVLTAAVGIIVVVLGVILASCLSGLMWFRWVKMHILKIISLYYLHYFINIFIHSLIYKTGRRSPKPPLTQDTRQAMDRWVCWNRCRIVFIALWDISTLHAVCPQVYLYCLFSLSIRETLVQCMTTSQAWPSPLLQHRQRPPSTKMTFTSPASTSLTPKTRKCLCTPPSNCFNPRDRLRMSSTLLWISTSPVLPPGEHILPLQQHRIYTI